MREEETLAQNDRESQSRVRCHVLHDNLVCPNHGGVLMLPGNIDFAAGMPWSDGEIWCSAGCCFPVEGGIPRFSARENYSAAFGLQWQRYRRTQLDSYTGVPLSRRRLERCLGMPVEALKDKTVLEVGSGAGRFTELLIGNCRALYSTDLSDAVEANLENCFGIGPYTLFQSNILNSPLRRHAFDVVICLGVIQHTPNTEQTIAALAEHVAPRGLLAIDHYAYRDDRWGAFIRLFSLATFLRPMMKRLSPETGMRLSILLTRICDPIRRRTSRMPQLDRFAARIFCSACYYATIPELDPEICREWNELDTHDILTDWYKRMRTTEQIRHTLEDLGFVNIWCEKGHRGGNGIEAHAVLGKDMRPFPKNT